MKTYKVGEIKEIIKGLLKKNKVTYSDLADHLECSEPTVKRILGPEEMTLTRLLQICDFLKLNLSDLEALMKNDQRETVNLSEKQQIFLVENKNHFAYLMEIYQEHTPEQIAIKYRLNSKSTQKYLINLEKYDLIKVSHKNKVRPYHNAFPHLGSGPLGSAFYRAFVQNSSAFFIDRISEEISRKKVNSEPEKEGSGYAIQSMNVNPETYRKFMKEINTKLIEFERVASFEEKTMDIKKMKTAVILLGSTTVEKDYKGLESLQKAFGEITNL